jgi:hypothetical protein
MFADPLGVLVKGTVVGPVTIRLSEPLADARVVALPK